MVSNIERARQTIANIRSGRISKTRVACSAGAGRRETSVPRRVIAGAQRSANGGNPDDQISRNYQRIGSIRRRAGPGAKIYRSGADEDKDSAKGTKGASEYAPGETQDRGTVKGIKPSPGVTTGSGSGAGSRHTGSDSPR